MDGFPEIERELLETLEEARKIVQQAALSEGRLSPERRLKAFDALTRSRPLLAIAGRMKLDASETERFKALRNQAYLLSLMWKNTKVEFPHEGPEQALGLPADVPAMTKKIDEHIDLSRTALSEGDLEQARIWINRAMDDLNVAKRLSIEQRTMHRDEPVFKELQSNAQETDSMLSLHEATKLINEGVESLNHGHYAPAADSGWKALSLSRKVRKSAFRPDLSLQMENSATRLVAFAPLSQANAYLDEAVNLLKKQQIEEATNNLRNSYNQSLKTGTWAQGLDVPSKDVILNSARATLRQSFYGLLSAARMELERSKAAFVNPKIGSFSALSSAGRSAKIAEDLTVALKDEELVRQLIEPDYVHEVKKILAEANAMSMQALAQSRAIFQRYQPGKGTVEPLEQVTRRLKHADELLTQGRTQAEALDPDASYTLLTARKLAREALRFAEDIKDPMVSEPLKKHAETIAERSEMVQKSGEAGRRILKEAEVALENAEGWLGKAGELISAKEPAKDEVRALLSRATAAIQSVRSAVEDIPQAKLLLARANGLETYKNELLARLARL